MGNNLTKKQSQVFDFIRDFTDKNGYSPSYREIMAELEINSVSAVAEHIEKLVEKGVIKKNPGEARTLEIVEEVPKEVQSYFKLKYLEASSDEKEILEKAAEILEIKL